MAPAAADPVAVDSVGRELVVFVVAELPALVPSRVAVAEDKGLDMCALLNIAAEAEQPGEEEQGLSQKRVRTRNRGHG